MTWLFTQVWLWSLFAFGLGSLITWLLFVRPLQRRLDQVLAEQAEEFDLECAPVQRDAPTETMDNPLGLFDPEPEEPVEEPPMGDWDRRPRPWLSAAQQTTGGRGGESPVRGGESESPQPESTVRFPAPEPAPQPQSEPEGQSQSSWFVAAEESTRPVEPVGEPAVEEPEAGASAPESAEEQPAAEEGGELPRRMPGAGPYPGKSTGDSGPKVKGHSASRQYHTPDSPVYDQIDADVWFRTAEDAEIAGFQPWNGRPVR